MRCPFCDHEELKVTDSRNASEANAIRRRRQCLNCEKRFTTFETIELSIQVKKKDGNYEDFQESKLVGGLMAACRHTRISREQVRALCAQVTSELMGRSSREITTQELGNMVMDHLKKLDYIAYIRFACVYRRFKDIDELIDEIANLDKKEALSKT